MNNYIKICILIDILSFDANTLNSIINTELREAYISYPEVVEDDRIKEYIKIMCKDCRTYAFTWISQQEFDSRVNKEDNILELDENLVPINFEV